MVSSNSGRQVIYLEKAALGAPMRRSVVRFPTRGIPSSLKQGKPMARNTTIRLLNTREVISLFGSFVPFMVNSAKPHIHMLAVRGAPFAAALNPTRIGRRGSSTFLIRPTRFTETNMTIQRST